MATPRRNAAKPHKSLLLLHAYLNANQTGLIQPTFQIEHIFPIKWQNTNYKGWNRKDADFYLESFGNKVILEKKLNIQAGNDYFGRKKERYKDSKIADVHDLSDYPKDDWLKDDIKKREKEFITRIITFFKSELQPPYDENKTEVEGYDDFADWELQPPHFGRTDYFRDWDQDKS